MPVNAEASCRFGVTRAARGISKVAMAWRASVETSGAPCLLIMTGSTTSGNVNSSGRPGDRFYDGRVAQRPGLGGGGRNVVEHSAQLRQDKIRREAIDAIKTRGVLNSE